jgi:hypothetical protein
MYLHHCWLCDERIMIDEIMINTIIDLMSYFQLEVF